jgi:hypothetical protein
MVQPSSNPYYPSPDFDYDGGPFPTHVPTEFPKQSARGPAAGPRVPVKTRAILEVAVLGVAGRLGDVVEDLDRAIQLALADGPRGVVCDLSAVFEGAEPGAVEVLATAGRHVRDWPGIPVAVACPDPQVRAALRAHPLGGHLIVTAEMLPAVSAVLASPVPAVEWLHLAPHPTAPRASRGLVTRTLLEWGLGWLIPSATLVVSELVTNSTIHAGTDIELSVARSQGALRLTVRDNSPDLPRQRYSQFDVHGRGLFVIAGLSRAVGVLPAVRGKVVWAVLDAPAASAPTSPTQTRAGARHQNQSPEAAHIHRCPRPNPMAFAPSPVRTQPTTDESAGSRRLHLIRPPAAGTLS